MPGAVLSPQMSMLSYSDEEMDHTIVDTTDHIVASSPPSGVITNAGHREISDQMENMLRFLLRAPTVTWSSPGQKLATAHGGFPDRDQIVILPTGGGKSLVALIPALLRSGVTVFVFHLLVILQDWQRRLRRMEVAYQTYDSAESSKDDIPPGTKIILTTINQSQTPHWSRYIKSVHARGRKVEMFVIDEAHAPLTNANFRRELSLAWRVRILPVPLLLLSATIPPSLETTVGSLWGLTDPPTVIRESTDRPELQYNVIAKDEHHWIQQIKDIVAQETLYFCNEDRILIFVTDKSVGHLLAKALQCQMYHGGDGLTREQRDEIYTAWLDGTYRVLIGTEALSAGHDNPHVRLLFHVNTPKGLIMYVQEVGRAGRDGRPAKCYLLATGSNQWMNKDDVEEQNWNGHLEMDQFVLTVTECRRGIINKFLDGVVRTCKVSIFL